MGAGAAWAGALGGRGVCRGSAGGASAGLFTTALGGATGFAAGAAGFGAAGFGAAALAAAGAGAAFGFAARGVAVFLTGEGLGLLGIVNLDLKSTFLVSRER